MTIFPFPAIFPFPTIFPFPIIFSNTYHVSVSGNIYDLDNIYISVTIHISVSGNIFVSGVFIIFLLTILAPTIRRFRISINGVFNSLKYLIRSRTICVTLRVESRVSCGLILLIPLELKRPLARHSAHLISLNY